MELGREMIRKVIREAEYPHGGTLRHVTNKQQFLPTVLASICRAQPGESGCCSVRVFSWSSAIASILLFTVRSPVALRRRRFQCPLINHHSLNLSLVQFGRCLLEKDRVWPTGSLCIVSECLLSMLGFIPSADSTDASKSIQKETCAVNSLSFGVSSSVPLEVGYNQSVLTVSRQWISRCCRTFSEHYGVLFLQNQ